LAVGFFKDIDELRAHWTADRTWKPGMADPERDATYRLWKKAVTRSFDWVNVS